MRTAAMGVGVLLFAGALAEAKTLQVGPGKKYKSPCQAFEAARDKDIIEIDAAGKYDGDVCTVSANSLVIRGVNGRPKIDAAGKDAQGKAMLAVSLDKTPDADATRELSGLEFVNEMYICKLD